MCEKGFIEGVRGIILTSSKNRSILEGNEAQTRWLLIDPMILVLWGYSREDVIVEYCIDNVERVTIYDKLDYSIILNNKPKLLVEAKSLGSDLYSKYPQLSSYFSNIYNSSIYKQNELIGLLTDGDLYLFFTDTETQGVLDTKPFLTIRLSISEDEEIIKLIQYSKDLLSQNSNLMLSEGFKEDYNSELGYDLSEYYRIDMIERVFNEYESEGITLCIQNVSIKGKFRNIKSFRTLYREILKEVNKLEPKLLYELAVYEESSRIEGLISERAFTLNPVDDSIKVETVKGVVYAPFSRTRKGMIDRIVFILKRSCLGLFNVLVKLKEK